MLYIDIWRLFLKTILLFLLSINIAYSTDVFEISGENLKTERVRSGSTITSRDKKVILKSKNTKIIVYEKTELVLTIKDNLSGVEIKRGSVLSDTRSDKVVFKTKDMSFVSKGTRKSSFKINQPIDKNSSLILFEGEGYSFSNNSTEGYYSFYDDILSMVSGSSRLSIKPYDVIIGSGSGVTRFDKVNRDQLDDISNGIKVFRVYSEEELLLSENTGAIVSAHFIEKAKEDKETFGIKRVVKKDESTWTQNYFITPSSTLKLASFVKENAWVNFKQVSTSVDAGFDFSKSGKSYGVTLGMSSNSLAYLNCDYCTFKTPQSSTTQQMSIYHSRVFRKNLISQVYLESADIPYLKLKGVPSTFGARHLGVSLGTTYGENNRFFSGADLSLASTDLGKGYRGSLEFKLNLDYSYNPVVSIKATAEDYSGAYISTGVNVGVSFNFD